MSFLDTKFGYIQKHKRQPSLKVGDLYYGLGGTGTDARLADTAGLYAAVRETRSRF